MPKHTRVPQIGVRDAAKFAITAFLLIFHKCKIFNQLGLLWIFLRPEGCREQKRLKNTALLNRWLLIQISCKNQNHYPKINIFWSKKNKLQIIFLHSSAHKTLLKVLRRKILKILCNISRFNSTMQISFSFREKKIEPNISYHVSVRFRLEFAPFQSLSHGSPVNVIDWTGK